MVFVSQNRFRGGRGRGRGVGEVAFQSASHDKDGGPRGDYESRTQVAEELRITVGNDKYRDNKQGAGMESRYGQRPGPSGGHYDTFRNEVGAYRRETDMYNSPSHSFRSQEGYGRDYEREAGDRRGLGASPGIGAQQSQPAYSASSRSIGQSYTSSAHTTSTSTASQSSASSRPLKSILKKKNDPADKPAGQQSQKPSGLPGMSNYLDDIDDEDKFLYGDDGDNKHGADNLTQTAHPTSGLDIKSAAQSWKPSAPSNTVSGIVSEFVSSQRNYSDRQSYTQPQQSVQYSQPASSISSTVGGGGDIWSMLAKSVQTVQSQQQTVQQQSMYGVQQQQNIYQAPLTQTVQTPVEPVQPAQTAQASETGHDPTIENILKSIGFDFDMSKRMQEKAKQAAGEVIPPKPPKTEESQFGIDHGASFIGSGMLHEDLRSSLSQQDSRDSHQYRRDSASKDYSDMERSQDYDRNKRESLDRKRDREYDEDRIDSHERKRGRSLDDNSNDSHDRYKSSYDIFSSPGKNANQTLADKDLSPVSDDGSPPPPMFNLPPITIKRKTGLERNRSPGWEQRRSSERTIQVKRNSRSPSFTKSTSSYGRRSNRSRSISRERDVPPKRSSPVITRTIMISQDFRKKFSPNRSKSPIGKKRSLSPVGRRSPGRRSSISPGRPKNRSPVRARSPVRGRSPGKRRSLSPGRDKRRSLSPKRGRSPRRSKSPRKRSRSPRRKSRSPRRRSRSPKRRSRSPKRRSRSPRKRSRSPRRRSRSPRGIKRSVSPRSSSRDRKLRRSHSGERFRSPGHGRRSRSISRDRARSKGSLSGESDSDVDGPANKEYFSSPLRLPGRPPRYYNEPPVSQPMQGPPPNFVPPGPPVMFGQGPPPVPMGGPPPFGMPPPFSVPPPGYPSQLTYIVPTEPPPVMDPSVPPPSSYNAPNLLPNQHVDLPDIPGEERRRYNDHRDDKGYKDSREGSSGRTVKTPSSSSRDKRSSSHERRIVIGSKPKSSSKSSSSSDKDSKKSADKEIDKAKIMKEKEDFDNKIKILQTEFTNLTKLEEELKANLKMTKENETILEENSKLRDEIKKELGKLMKDRKAFENKHSSILLKDTSSKREITVSKKTDSSKKLDDKKDTSTRKSDDRRDSSSKKSDDKKDTSSRKSDDKKDTSSEKKDVKTDSQFKVEKGKMMKHQFVDNGDHWCKGCNIDFPNILDFVQHLSSYKHKQTIPSDFRPWKEGFQPHEGMIVNKNGIRVPLPGIEFMYPVTAYYCKLCKVFLGDVSCGADHFKCESHYIKYQAYCKDNPYHAKKLQEDKDAFYKKKSEIKKEEKRERDRSKLTSSDVREQERKKKEESDSKIRDSRKWSDENDRKDKRSSESERRHDKSDKVKTDSDKNKHSQENSSTQKSSGLPPWQSVSKKVEEPAKSSLDSFLTTDSESGKVPVIVDKKKKVSAQDVLKRFNEKKKLKEIQEREAKEKEYEAQLEQERKEKQALQLQLAVLKNEQALQIQMETSKNQKEIEQLKTELAKEKYKGDKLEVEDMEIDEPEDAKDMQMMGIDPMSAAPLFNIIPPPPRTQNIPHPNQKAHSTVSASDVRNVFFTNKSNETKPTPFSNESDVANIPLPEFITDKKKSKDVQHEEKNPVKKDQSPKKHWKVFYEPVDNETTNDNSNVKVENVDQKEEQSDNVQNSYGEVHSNSVKKNTVDVEKPVVHIEVAIDNENDSKSKNEKHFKVKEEEVGVLMIEEDEKELKKDDNISQTNECKIEIEMTHVKANTENAAEDETNIVIETNERTMESNQATAVDEETNDETKTSKESSPTDDDVAPRGKRGGKRGRGRGRGKGRGRGSRGASTTKRSTRATRSNVSFEEPDESLVDSSSEAQTEIQDKKEMDHKHADETEITETENNKALKLTGSTTESEKGLPVDGNNCSKIQDKESTNTTIVEKSEQDPSGDTFVENTEKDPSGVVEIDNVKELLDEDITHSVHTKDATMVVDGDVKSDVNSVSTDMKDQQSFTIKVPQSDECETTYKDELPSSMEEQEIAPIEMSQSLDISNQNNENEVKSSMVQDSVNIKDSQTENIGTSNDKKSKAKETSERLTSKVTPAKRSARAKRSSKRSKKQDEIDSKIESDIAQELTEMKVSEEDVNEDTKSNELVDNKECSERAVDESNFVRRSTRTIRSSISPVKQDENLVELNSDIQTQSVESPASEVQSDSRGKEPAADQTDTIDSMESPKSVTKKTPGKRGRKKTRSNIKSKNIESEIHTEIQPEIDLNLLDTDNALDSSKYSEMIDIEEGPDGFGIQESSSLQENVNVEINLIGDNNSTVEVNVTNENSSVLNVKNKEKEFDVLLSGVNMVEDNSSSFDFGSPLKTRRTTSGADKDKASDAEDNVSEHSGISMHISSDFEVVDDIEDDLADVLPLP